MFGNHSSNIALRFHSIVYEAPIADLRIRYVRVPCVSGALAIEVVLITCPVGMWRVGRTLALAATRCLFGSGLLMLVNNMLVHPGPGLVFVPIMRLA